MNQQHPFTRQPASPLTSTPNPGLGSALAMHASMHLVTAAAALQGAAVTASVLIPFTCHKLLPLYFKRKKLKKNLGVQTILGVEVGCFPRCLPHPPEKWQLPGEQGHPKEGGDSRDRLLWGAAPRKGGASGDMP